MVRVRKNRKWSQCTHVLLHLVTEGILKDVWLSSQVVLKFPAIVESILDDKFVECWQGNNHLPLHREHLLDDHASCV